MNPTFTPIGIIRTPFSAKRITPRQAVSLPEDARAEGLIELYAGQNYEQALEDLAGFERIWIVSWFHRNTGWKPKVLPPRRSLQRRGVFATRSPHRPNPIGISAARLLEIKGRTLRVAEIDLLDNTPILDLKPYLPYADAFPKSKAGWLDETGEDHTDVPAFAVTWTELARSQAEWLRREHAVDLAESAERVLGTSPEPHPYRRISKLRGMPDWGQLAVQSWRVIFNVLSAEAVRIERIASGYSAAALTEAKPARPLHQPDAHRAFHRKWNVL